MATDNSPPRVRAIFITAVIAFMILVGLKFVFDSYYVTMFEEEEFLKIGSTQSKQLADLRAGEKKNLANSAMPIDRAMMLLAKSRDEASAAGPDGGVTPIQSTDTAALIGWAKLPHDLTPAETAAVDAGANMAIADGGATDGAASSGVLAMINNTGGDAGAPASNALPDAGAAPKHDAGISPHP